MENDEFPFGEWLPVSDLINLLSSDPSNNTDLQYLYQSPTPHDDIVIRRERVKESEAKRRERIGDLMKDLEVLVAKELGVKSKKRKQTKEEILRQAITLLNKYIDKQDPQSNFGDLGRLTKRHKDNGLLLEVPISKDEEKVTFKVLFHKASMMEFTKQTWNKNDYLGLVHQLNDIALSIGEVEYKLCVSWLLASFYGFISLNISEFENINKRAQLCYNEMKSLNRKPLQDVYIPFNFDTDLLLIIDKAMLHAFYGKFQDAISTFRLARILAHKLPDRNSRCYYYSSVGSFYYAIGEKIPNEESLAGIEENKNPTQDLIGSLFTFTLNYQLALSQLEILTDKELKMEALNRMISESNELNKFYPEAKLILAALLIYAHLISGSINDGIKLADDTLKISIERGIHGAYGRSEIMRLKADLLMKKYENDKDIDYQCIQEIRLLLSNAISNSLSNQLITTYLKSAISYSLFVINFIRNSNSLEIDDAIQVLRDAMKMVQPYPQSTLISDANITMEKLITLKDTSSSLSSRLLLL